MNDNKKYNLYKGITEKLSNINKSNDSEDLEESIDDFINYAHNTIFDTYVKGWTDEKEKLVDRLLYFIKRNEIKKSKYISWMLNTYYKGTTDELFDELLKNEEYEILENFKDIKNTTDMPLYY